MSVIIIDDLSILPASEEDSEFVYHLRFVEEDKYFYFYQDKISSENHNRFWRNHWKDYYIGRLEGRRIGFYGIVEGDFRISIIPEMRGLGIGSLLIKDAVNRLCFTSVRVLKNNKASLSAFHKNGFFIVGENVMNDCEYFILSI
jgi:GNAT superfamily N-acetyltransferase